LVLEERLELSRP